MRCIVNVEDAGAVVPPLPSSLFADGGVHEASSLEDSPDGSPPPSNPAASSATAVSLSASTSGSRWGSALLQSAKLGKDLFPFAAKLRQAVLRPSGSGCPRFPLTLCA